MRRLRQTTFRPLVADEHTAQVTNERRVDLENRFKASAAEAPLNVLACSPTMEMGIDVGGLDAVILRNVPPRPDNYAQRALEHLQHPNCETACYRCLKSYQNQRHHDKLR